MSEFRKYFNHKKPAGAITLIVFGVIIFLAGISTEETLNVAMIGLGMLALGIYLVIKFNANKSDDIIDNYCADQANQYFASKKQIVNSQDNAITETICTSGYCFDNLFSARTAIRGKDKVWRSSIFEMSCVFISEEMLYCYNKKISLITNEKIEMQRDFRLQDIHVVSIEEINQSVAVSIVIPGNEKIYINCKNKQEAIDLCDKIKKKET